VRAALYTLSDNSAWLIGVQLLDGVGAGIFGAITPLVLADLMRGTGRYNLAQGTVATAQGIGASSSGLAAGLIVDHLGYPAAFLAASAVAATALLVLAGMMPETRDAPHPVPVISAAAAGRKHASRRGPRAAEIAQPDRATPGGLRGPGSSSPRP
jgi:MFS family permease